MYINRHIENVIKRESEAFPAVLVTGSRQIGKSTTLKHIYPDMKYINLDDRIALLSMHEDPVGFLQLQGTPLILDEIQRDPESFLSIKYLIDERRSAGMYYLTGSQKYLMMEKASESLAGRIGIISMYGLSNREIKGETFNRPFLPCLEYLRERNITPEPSPGSLWEKIHKGSMPELYANDKMKWESYYASYVDTYIERDMRALSQVGDTLAFLQFMTALASRTGCLLNMHDIAKDAGIDDKTVKRWISILQTSGIIYLLRPFHLNISKRIVKTPKIYFMDTGLAAWLCRWLTPETLRNGAMSGSIFETWVVSEIIKSYNNMGKEPDIYFFRNTDGQEVDLLFYENGSIYPLEIKKTAAPNPKDVRHFKTLSTFFPELQIKEGGVICTYPEIMPLCDGRYTIPASAI